MRQALAERAEREPVEVLEQLLLAYGGTWNKEHLWIEMGISGTGVGLTIERKAPLDERSPSLAPLKLKWHASACDAVRRAAANRSSEARDGALAWSGKAGPCGEYELHCRPMPWLSGRFPSHMLAFLSRESFRPEVKAPSGRSPVC